ncbi:hypothetical protein [Verrucomicrobium sp. BvORR106]|uniref:hypothetical protein n=1 Tax=Verrucomicrobium sp. BvORR106 TaxID=1403819 RepID=UPI002240F333|nr:hypothetical protein [Verrucomicrobium sp. BvORR106]
MLAILLGGFSCASLLSGQLPSELRAPDLLAPVVPSIPLMSEGLQGEAGMLKPLVDIVLPRPELSEQIRATIDFVLIVPLVQESGIPVRRDVDAGGKLPDPWRLDQSPRMKLRKFRVQP